MGGFYILNKFIFFNKMFMSENISPYLKYLTSNLILVNSWIEKFGISSDPVIIKHANSISEELNKIMNRMEEVGIEVDQMTNEAYDIDKHIRDFKIIKLLDERN